MLRARLLPATVALALLGATSACAEPEATPEPFRPEVTSLFVDLPDATPEQMNAAADVVRARLMALDLDVAEVGWDDAAIEVIVPIADEQLARLALQPPGDLEFRPVLEVLDPAGSRTTTPVGDRGDEATVTASSDDGLTYVLGPAGLGGEALEDASAAALPGSDEWVVQPVFRTGAEGIDAFNELAAQCFDGTPACPALAGNGQLAVVFDGVVVSAPTINVASFERDEIQLSGGFDESDARALAAALRGGAAEVTWTVRG